MRHTLFVVGLWLIGVGLIVVALIVAFLAGCGRLCQQDAEGYTDQHEHTNCEL